MDIQDPAYLETEAIIKQLEKRISKEYLKAEKEVQAKLDDYLRRFEIKDKKWQEWVQTGYKTEKQYKEWKVGQIIVGRRWEELRDNLAEDYHNANKIAQSIIEGRMPDVYAINHDYGTWEIENGGKVNTSYTLYNREAAEKLLKGDSKIYPNPGKKLTEEIEEAMRNGKDIRWNKQQIESVMLQSLLQGESIPDIATRLAKTVGEKDRNVAIRNARTMATGIQNMGRLDAYRRGAELGVESEKMWLATLDERTRHSHRDLDGMTVPIEEEFPNGCMEPGDPNGGPEEVFNCRCGMRAVVSGLKSMARQFRDYSDIEDDYETWKKGHATKSNPLTLPEEKAARIKWSYIKEYRTH